MDSSRKEKALVAIKASAGTDAGEYGVDLFINHHLEELNDSEWSQAIGISKPTKQQVLESLTLTSCWDEGLAYDFSLPNDVTDYVVSVRYDESGEIEEISMES
jgi:hypothetical protein